jgi:hypothetical protein
LRPPREARSGRRRTGQATLAASISAFGSVDRARWLWVALRSSQKNNLARLSASCFVYIAPCAGRETRAVHRTLLLHMTWRPVMPNDRDQTNDRYKGWAPSTAIIATSLLIAGVFLHTWVGERTRAASQVSASLTPGEAAPAR